MPGWQVYVSADGNRTGTTAAAHPPMTASDGGQAREPVLEQRRDVIVGEHLCYGFLRGEASPVHGRGHCIPLPHACVAGTRITPVERQVPMPVCCSGLPGIPARGAGPRSATRSEATTLEGVLKRDRAIVLAAGVLKLARQCRRRHQRHPRVERSGDAAGSTACGESWMVIVPAIAWERSPWRRLALP